MKLFGFVRGAALFSYNERSGECADQRFGCMSVEIPDHPVVIDNAQLVVGEMHGKEEVVLLVTCMSRVFKFHLIAHQRGGGSAVMAISDISGGHSFEHLDNTGDNS